MSSEKQTPGKTGISGLVFVGCLLIALAAGLLTGKMAIAILAGLGVGFIGMALVRFATGQW